MKYLIYMILLFSSMNPKIIFDFNKKADVREWIVVDDAVMGGESSSTFNLNDDGFGVLKAVYHLRTMEDFLLCVIDSKKYR
jgi:hypothetical protein